MDKTQTALDDNFFKGTIEELKKVSWPSKKTTIQLTVTVIIISLIVGAYLGIIDLLLAKVLDFLTKR